MPSTIPQQAWPIAAPPLPAAQEAVARALLDRAISALLALVFQRITRMLGQLNLLMQAWQNGTLPPPPPPRAHRPGLARSPAPAPGPIHA